MQHWKSHCWKAFFCFTKHFAFASPISLLLAGTTSCVVFEHPVGKWAEPVDLQLHATSLAGTSIEVQCLNKANEDFSTNELCINLAQSLKASGATVIPELSPSENTIASASEGRPTLKIILQSTKTTTGLCGWTLVPMIFSFSLFPCKAEADTFATLTVRDILSGHETSWPLQIHLNRYVGIGALVLMGVDNIREVPRLAYHDEIMMRFINFVQSKTYTAATKQSTSL